MPEDFYLAARFASLEQAGESYAPIQELLRAHGDTDLSVYRFELRGVAHVAVLGIEPPEPIMAAINQALSPEEPVILEEEIAAWLLHRREQRDQREGFSEAHYTRGTGPRPFDEIRTAPDRSRPRVRRRRVSTLQVTWNDELPGREDATGTITDLRTGAVFAFPSQFSGVCDWCTAELAPPVAAIHHFAVELEFPDGFVTGTGGKWATCRMCQERLKLKPGDTRVSFDAVDRLWRTHGARYLGDDVRRLKIRTFHHEGE
jgi:hypothetical protein